MGMISFSDKSEETWSVAGWAFRQILDDVISQHPEDLEIIESFDRAVDYSGLSIDLLNPELALRVSEAIWQVATDILAGKIRTGLHDKPYGDAATIEQYREGLQCLLESFPASWKDEENRSFLN